MSTPLLLKDLPIYSYYRYISCCIVVLLVILCYILAFKYKFFYNMLAIVKYPYLQEELRLILKGLFDNFLGSCCVILTNNLIKHNYISSLYFIIHFIFIIVVKIITMSLFFNFVFLSGDLRLVLYCLPFSFVSWVLGNLYYYHFRDFEGNLNYLKDCLNVTLKPGITLDIQNTFVNAFTNDFIFSITLFGYEKGFTNEHYPRLISTWFELCSVNVTLTKYKNKLKYISLMILAMYIICWFYITVKFFFMDDQTFITL